MPRALEVLCGAQQGALLVLEPGRYAVGTARRAALRLRDQGVSYNHARLVVAETILLEDLRSREGTFLNGARIEEAHVVEPGDELRFGTVRVRVLSDPSQATPEPEPVVEEAQAPEVDDTLARLQAALEEAKREAALARAEADELRAQLEEINEELLEISEERDSLREEAPSKDA